MYGDQFGEFLCGWLKGLKAIHLKKQNLTLINETVLNITYIAGRRQVKNNFRMKCSCLHFSLLKQMKSLVPSYNYMKWIKNLTKKIKLVITNR